MNISSHPALTLFALTLPLMLMLYFFSVQPETIPQDNNLLQKNNTLADMNNNTTTVRMDTVEQDYMAIHNEAIMIDTHNDFVYQVYEKGVDIANRNPNTHSDLPKFKEGGVDVQIFAVWIPMKEVKNSYGFTTSQIDRLKTMAQQNSSQFEFANTYDDVIRITNEGKLCGLIGIEGGTAIGNDLEKVKEFYDLGVRYIGLTWNNSNLIASSAKDETERGKAGGLTDFGTQVIRKMNETGMIIDVSHLGEKSFWDVIEISTDPIIASHSNCYSLNPHYRNLTDEQIKAIAEKGGYIGINFYNKFLVKSGGADIEDVVRHIDHLKDLVGVDYIGIGADFDGGITPPAGLEDVTRYPELTSALLQRGYTKEDVTKILGGNFLRVYKQVCG